MMLDIPCQRASVNVPSLILSQNCIIDYRVIIKDKFPSINIAIHKISMCQVYVPMLLCGEYSHFIKPKTQSPIFMGQDKAFFFLLAACSL